MRNRIIWQSTSIADCLPLYIQQWIEWHYTCFSLLSLIWLWYISLNMENGCCWKKYFWMSPEDRPHPRSSLIAYLDVMQKRQTEKYQRKIGKYVRSEIRNGKGWWYSELPAGTAKCIVTPIVENRKEIGAFNLMYSTFTSTALARVWNSIVF